MLRTLAACVVSAVVGAALAAGAGLGARSAKPRVITVPVGGTAVFAGRNLLCVNEPASGAPRFHHAGVACSSHAQPYGGLGIWLTRTELKLTRPPNGKLVATLAR